MTERPLLNGITAWTTHLEYHPRRCMTDVSENVHSQSDKISTHLYRPRRQKLHDCMFMQMRAVLHWLLMWDWHFCNFDVISDKDYYRVQCRDVWCRCTGIMENISSKEKSNTFLRQREIDASVDKHTIWRMQRWTVCEKSDSTGPEDSIEVELELMDATEGRAMLRLDTSDANKSTHRVGEITTACNNLREMWNQSSCSHVTKWLECFDVELEISEIADLNQLYSLIASKWNEDQMWERTACTHENRWI